MRACTQSLEVQITGLATLADGWMNGEGKALTMTLLAQVSRVVTQLVELYAFTMPFLYPTSDGGAVRAEWPGDHWEVVVWIKDAGLELIATENAGAGLVDDAYSTDMAGIACCADKMTELLKEKT